MATIPQQMTGLHVHHIDLYLQHHHEGQMQLFVYLQLHGVGERLHISDERLGQLHDDR